MALPFLLFGGIYNEKRRRRRFEVVLVIEFETMNSDTGYVHRTTGDAKQCSNLDLAILYWLWLLLLTYRDMFWFIGFGSAFINW